MIAPKEYIKIIQVLVYFLSSSTLKWCYNVHVNFPQKLLDIKKGRYIIVSNHKKAVDASIIMSTLPYQIFKLLIPVRFFTANIFLRYWWQKLFLLSYGCFRAYTVEGKMSGMEAGIKLSDKNQTLFIFPEGRRVKNGTKVELKSGLAYLVKNRDFTIIPVFIDYSKDTIHKKTIVIWGEPFEINKTMQKKNLRSLTSFIFDQVNYLNPGDSEN